MIKYIVKLSIFVNIIQKIFISKLKNENKKLIDLRIPISLF